MPPLEPADLVVHYPKLRRYALSLLRDEDRAADLVQATMLHALPRLEQYTPMPGSNLRAWLFTMMHNIYVNDIRASVRRGTQIELDDANLPPKPPNQHAGLVMRDLKRSLACMPKSMQRVLLLAAEGATYEQMSESLDLDLGTVRSRLSRGRDLLRTLMET